MKAAVINRFGDADCIEVAEVPDAHAGPGEALIGVRAASLNHLDIWVRKGRPGATMKFPHILGSDAAGVVIETGPGVTGCKAGDQVLAHPGLGCGVCDACRRGEVSECRDFGIVGLSRPGTFAQRVAVPAANVFPKPPHLSFEEASCLGVAYLTAWRMLITRARVQLGETVLIHGVGGGVALAALQFAKLLCAYAIVTSSSDEKLARAKSLGAAQVINYRTVTDVAATVREMTGGRGVDVSINSVGAAAWPIDVAVLRKGGRAVLCGVTTGSEAPTDLRAVYWNQLNLMGSTDGSFDDMRAMIQAMVVAQLHPIVDSTFSLAQVREATLKMEQGRQFGKIVLTIA